MAFSCDLRLEAASLLQLLGYSRRVSIAQQCMDICLHFADIPQHLAWIVSIPLQVVSVGFDNCHVASHAIHRSPMYIVDVETGSTRSPRSFAPFDRSEGFEMRSSTFVLSIVT